MTFLTVTTDFLPQGGGLARYADAVCRVFAPSMSVRADIMATDAQKHLCKHALPYAVSYEPFL
ncbi:hypothetical protein HYV72_02245, partial [Candidatus Uhrbacteria bacterium]|nr:hypothetical protein [Candidatus Uhrbacteria bacterium]